ncbi:MAG: hypothetical protein HY054_10815 [Proteobacteria bacterium]|nr:hypothetical protein [Pseudomonadota bacterium]
MRKLFGTAVGAIVLLAAAPVSAQTRLFSDNSEVAITLSGPLSTIQRAAVRNTDPRPGTVTLAGAASQTFNVQIAARGFVRRTGGICAYTPLGISFHGDALRGTLFQGQGKLKIVAPCRGGDSYQQLVVLEYLAYRLYNEMTPMSFRVRPVRITYHDTDNARGRDDTRWGFFIEDKDDVAHRNHRVALDVHAGEVAPSGLDADAATRAALFEYMISNLDWDMLSGHADDPCCHNHKLVAASATARTSVVPVPYDFDYSGLVSAPYAIPPEGIRIRDVRTRYYRGYCRFNDQLPTVIADVRSRRADFYGVVDNQPNLDAGHKRTAHAFLDDFFSVLDDPARVARELTNHCRRG